MEELYFYGIGSKWKKWISEYNVILLFPGLVFNNDGDKITEGTCSCNVAKGFFKDKWDGCRQARKDCEPDHELNGETGRPLQINN